MLLLLFNKVDLNPFIVGNKHERGPEENTDTEEEYNALNTSFILILCCDAIIIIFAQNLMIYVSRSDSMGHVSISIVAIT
ncbi:hypothetical protein Glove_166g260 [Diversispora epigaea]|uniref:Uncharacterized protein n=1 Tax=Diversispora epigaea TaxID=1348612 RepID=A0A397IU34_9GLOM|nr:hypothetical protein Glove_166g260 [Diversispora epigaea]